MKHRYITPSYSVPMLSKKNVNFIEKTINLKNIDTIIEYGSGSSTLYFIKKLKNKKINFISVENAKFWFYDNFEYVAGSNTFDYCKPDPRHLTNVLAMLGGE